MENNDGGITRELIQEILSNVKLMLNIKDSEQDSILTLYINMICNNILIQTNRRVFPQELKYVVINLVADKFNSNIPDSDRLSIQSMTEYDRSVNFGVSDILSTKLNMIAQKQIEENYNLIKAYKLLYRVNMKPQEKGDNDG